MLGPLVHSGADETICKRGAPFMLQQEQAQLNDSFVMAYTSERPSHGLGKRIENFEEAMIFCGFDREINVEDCYSSGGFLLPDCRAVRDSDGRYMGTVGPEYTAHQDRDLVNLARTYIETGLVSFDTAGMFNGGAHVWIALRVHEGETIPGEAIKKYLFLAQGHDSVLPVVQGPTDIRIECSETLNEALREGIRTKHCGSVVEAAQKVQRLVLAVLENERKRIEAYRFADGDEPTPESVRAFLDDILTDEMKLERMSIKFQPGNGRSAHWWEILNTASAEESVNKMLLGTKLNEAAIKIALSLLQKKKILKMA